MRFTHFADCHIGAWRDQKLSDVGLKAFEMAISKSIEKKVDFVLIPGDIFNTALPPIDKLKSVVMSLKRLKNNNIPLYVVPGSHDYSPSGKTMLDVLEKADLLINVCKGSVEGNILKLNFTVDPKTNAKITGMIGKKGMLDRKYYENLDRESLEKEEGFKIFLFHTALSELKPKNLEKMESSPVSLLPKGFDYYAGGHVHIIENKNINGYNIAYPGALFPNNFREIEIFKNGGYYFYDDGNITWNAVVVKEVECMEFECTGKNPADILKEIMDKIKELDVSDKIVTIRVKGKLSSGKPTDIRFDEVFGILYHKGAYFVMKSTSMVETREFEKIQTRASSIEEAEEKVIKENLGQSKIKNEEELLRNLINIFSIEKEEGETKYNFEKRLIEESEKIIR